MRRRWVAAIGFVLAVALIGAPASAGDFTGSEEQEQTLRCPAKGKSVPSNQEPPGPGECTKKKHKTYRGKVWDNDVQCAKGGQDLQVINLYETGGAEEAGGGIGVCNDQSTVPVQGRVVFQGSMEQGGFSVYADGDKDNTPAQLQGWARLDVSTDGGGVTCGDEAGKRDATDPTSSDGSDDCG
jgi:hypothetical protein